MSAISRLPNITITIFNYDNDFNAYCDINVIPFDVREFNKFKAYVGPIFTGQVKSMLHIKTTLDGCNTVSLLKEVR